VGTGWLPPPLVTLSLLPPRQIRHALVKQERHQSAEASRQAARRATLAAVDTSTGVRR
jgi:hypothetical protein